MSIGRGFRPGHSRPACANCPPRCIHCREVMFTASTTKSNLWMYGSKLRPRSIRPRAVRGRQCLRMSLVKCALGAKRCIAKLRLERVGRTLPIVISRQGANAVGLMAPTFLGPPHKRQRASKFTWKWVKSSLGGEVHSFSEMADIASIVRKFYEHSADSPPSMIGFGDCGSPSSHPKGEQTTTDKSLETGELGDVYEKRAV